MINQIENNMNINGGGLAINITGKYESNRHAIAKIKKFTFGEVVSKLATKKFGGIKLSASDLLDAYRLSCGEPEWHHAGFLPKSYGGGMKKTYFLNEIPNISQVKNWLKKASKLRLKKLIIQETRNGIFKKQREFLNANAKRFERLSSAPEFSVEKSWEMNGKFGWFESNSRYSLPEYVSGWAFESQELMDQYYSI